MTGPQLRERVAELERQLADAQQAIDALVAGHVDSVVQAEGATGPILLQRAQETLRQNEQLLRENQYILEGAQAVAQIGSWVAGIAPNGGATWSKETCRMFGVPESLQVTTETFFDCVHENDREHVRRRHSDLITRDLPYNLEYRIVRSDGTVRWVHARVIVERDVDATPIRTIGVIRDITEERRVVEELRASEQRYRRIVESTSEGVYIVDRQGKVLFTNGPFADMLGYSRPELVGTSIFSFMDEEARAVGAMKLAERLRGVGGTHEHRFRRRDGSEVWTLVNSNPLCDEAGNFEESLALITDISARRRSDEARDRLAAIVESSEDAIISESLDGTITSWNRRAEQLYGYLADEVIGRPASILLPDELVNQPGQGSLRSSESKAIYHYETQRRRKDGSTIDVSLTVSPIRSSAGNIVGVSRIIRDLTEQRKTEKMLRRTEEQLRQAQKMEALGILVGSIAHDFNNVLSVVLAYACSMIDSFGLAEPLRSDAEEIKKAAERAAGLTRQLLAFSRQQVLQPRVLELKQVIRGVEKVLRRILGEEIDLILHFDESTSRVCADPGQIEQVVMNLVINARDAMPRGGTVTVELSDVVLEPIEGVTYLGLPAGSYVMLAVSDSGIGMDAATRERIFEPFFTTKERGKGTGLGLSTVFGIVQQSGGNMWVYSEPGKGSTFKIYLPSTGRAADSISAPTASTAHGGSETILLVEDEEQVRRASRTILVRSGYKVLEAPNAAEALAIAADYSAPIHLLLTDLVMPQINGRVLAERLTNLRPDMSVLFMSGYTDRTIIHHGMLDANVHFLQKPVTPTVLNRKVREVLDLPSITALRGGGVAN